MDPYFGSTNLIYNMLFCDDIELYKQNTSPPYAYPLDVVLDDNSSATDLQTIVDDAGFDARLRLLAYRRLLDLKQTHKKKELLGVIVEVGLDGGLDTLASYKDGKARYINQSGKIIIWETVDPMSNGLTRKLFAESEKIVEKIGPWEEPRRPRPAEGDVRISFLVSDGLYFGEGPMDVLFEDPMAAPALDAATQLLQHLTEKGTLQNTNI